MTITRNKVISAGLQGSAGRSASARCQYTGSSKTAAGIALVSVLLLVLLMTMMGIVGIHISRQQDLLVGKVDDQVRARLAAEEALNAALASDPGQRAGDDENIHWHYTGEGAGDNYTYDYAVSYQLVNDRVVKNRDGRTHYVINSSGKSGNSEFRLEAGVYLATGTGLPESRQQGVDKEAVNVSSETKSRYSIIYWAVTD